MIIQFIHVLSYWIGDQISPHFQGNHTLSYQYIYIFYIIMFINEIVPLYSKHVYFAIMIFECYFFTFWLFIIIV